jgi:hypothetical protein
MVIQDYLFMAVLLCALVVMVHWEVGRHSWKH